MEKKIIIRNSRNGLNTTIHAKKGALLSALLQDNGYRIPLECGIGKCGKCKVKLLSGTPAPILSGENIFWDKFHILTCRCAVGDSNLELEIDSQNTSQNNSRQKNGKLGVFDLKLYVNEPKNINLTYLQLPHPTFEDQRADDERILDYFPKGTVISPDLLPVIPQLLIESDYKISVVISEDAIISLEADNNCDKAYGIVIDMGTTTIAGYLIDTVNYEILATAGRPNLQKKFGSDVISRIGALDETAKDSDNTPASAQDMRQALLQSINEVIKDLFKLGGINLTGQRKLYQIICVGNTVISHFFMGVNPAALSKAPFIPCFINRQQLKARDLEFAVLANCRIDLLANIGGYVGSDALAAMMAIDLAHKEEISLLIDLGTNAEIILGYKNFILACSAPAGPVFEGAHITYGMRAEAGAIQKAVFLNGKLLYDVIGNIPARGLCGSGLMDVIKILVELGIIQKDGRFNQNPQIPFANRLRTTQDKLKEFMLIQDSGNAKTITITQQDIREFQLAKGAIRAGIEILLKKSQLNFSQISKVYLAGSFGGNINPENAIKLGLLPETALNNPGYEIISIGNAAAYGAAMCLVSKNKLEFSDKLARKVEVVELANFPDFNDIWLNSLNF